GEYRDSERDPHRTQRGSNLLAKSLRAGRVFGVPPGRSPLRGSDEPSASAWPQTAAGVGSRRAMRVALAAGAAGAQPAAAPDGPGALSHFDLARKDCLGTARNTTSQVWFTVANG